MPKKKTGYGDSKASLTRVIGMYTPDMMRRSDFLKDAGPWFLTMNDDAIAPLPKDWLASVQAFAPEKLSNEQEQNLALVVHTYYFKRLAIVSSIREQALRARLERIKSSALNLMEAIEIDSPDLSSNQPNGRIAILAWEALEAVEPDTLVRDEFYPGLTLLINRAHRALQDDNIAQSVRTAPDPEKAWVSFVSSIIDIFRSAGGNVTITKRGGSTRKPSNFSQFAWAIVQALPEKTREHSSDEWALSEALSSARRKIHQGFLREAIAEKKPE